MKCIICGNEIEEGMLFCPFCGAPQKPAEDAAESKEENASDAEAKDAADLGNSEERADDPKDEETKTADAEEKADASEEEEADAPEEGTTVLTEDDLMMSGTLAAAGAPKPGQGAAPAPAPMPQGAAPTPTPAPNGAAPQGAPMPQGVKPGSNTAAKPAPKKSKGFNPLFIIIPVAAAFLLLVGIVIAVLSYKPKVDLNEYVTVTYSGYSSVGTADYEFDYLRFNEDYADKIKFSSKARKDLYFGSKATLYPTDFLATCGINGYLDNDTSLSNGDTVTFVWDITDEELEVIKKYFRVRLKYEDIETVVTGLEEVPTFDPFDGVNVTYEGMDGNGTARIDLSEAKTVLNSYEYSFDNASGLSNGDTVTLRIGNSYSSKDDMIRQYIATYDKAPSSFEKEFKVEGLSKYVESADDIPKDMMDKMIEQTKSAMEAKHASEFSDTDNYTYGTTYIGYYFIVSKAKPGEYSPYNKLYIVFRNDLTVTDEDTGESSSYVSYSYCGYQNIMILGDGVCSVDLQDYEFVYERTQIDDYTTWSWPELYGYKNIDSMFNNLIAVNVDRYSYEDKVSDIDAPAAPQATSTDAE